MNKLWTDTSGIAPLLMIWICLGAPCKAQQQVQLSEQLAATPGKAAIVFRHKLHRARLAIEHNDQLRLKKLKSELRDYPLAPYLDYWIIHQKLPRLPMAEIDRFLIENDNTAIGDWMRMQLLAQLGSLGQFKTYLEYYRPERHNRTALRCYYADALFRHGDKAQAYRLARALWLVGHSQAEACDPVFAQWADAGGLTQQMIWRRHLLALKEGNLALAAYIARKMQAPYKELAAHLRQVHKTPELLLNHSRLLVGTHQNREIILHGLYRLARQDAARAEQAWQRYSANFLFSDTEQEAMLRHLARQFARQENMQGLLQLGRGRAIRNGHSIEWLARQSLRELDWEQVAFWIDRLPPAKQQLDRWLYWKARSLEELYGKSRTGASAHLYRQLAQKRSYYGFLAADVLGQHYSFVHRPAPITPDQVQKIARRPALQRARELQAMGEFFHARREWNYATREMTPEELLAAGKVASHWGWHHKSIQSVLAADYLDDLELRFPLAFADIIHNASERVGRQNSPLDPYLIYAVARQESHFSHDAKSSAGALGIMQLLPSTARDTARRSGVPYRRSWDLLSPNTNIILGSFYLSTLLNRFDNNRILAAAAYNAGPSRVAKWLRETRKRLPYDVWIETIPYKETRTYVQNVLAYTVIYAYRNGARMQLLRESEVAGKL
ncbi:transglycosylase SLT domain-containing protein [Microbulbifer spongiae]|uniref:Transglycosylase SLT domain-containing protein n=1 Tax=Microbulbifer spongiae TaxID=2944933 RepID=A0ABY9EFP3_9GAMM|nr:transglycosylase SLT domain-containing protein [Microbulbifer sp. MI-G]WKD51325.1 transglycosylase SLT domain-containing protein [Microbulbifer sp. MI-G]